MAVKEIVKDTEFLQQKSAKADVKSPETMEVIRDLIDTANEHKGGCVGLSAIQIGVPLRVCVVFNGNEFIPFINPIITSLIYAFVFGGITRISGIFARSERHAG